MFKSAFPLRRGNLRCSLPLSITLALAAACSASCVAKAATLCVEPGGKFGCMTTIGAAVAAASAGDTIQVIGGVYKEEVTITKALSLIAFDHTHPVIDATGLSNGILINGMSAAPSAGVANVLISGLTVRKAKFEGILAVNASDVTLAHNRVLDNDQGLDISTPACPGISAFETSEGEDCGEGIHFIGVNSSSIVQNEIDHNSGGILFSDETGVTGDNLVSGNFVHDNPYDCGITLASHPPATTVIPSATVSYGVVRNTIAHNTSSHNGAQVPGAGAGVGIFAPGPGSTAAGNVVIDNDLVNNGLPGVTMHNHASAPAPAPPVHFNGNVIVKNRISGNGADTADAATSGTTGINIFSQAPIYGTIVSENEIENEALDVVFNAPAGQLNVHFNNFNSTGVGIDNAGMSSVNATDNWWGCPAGPGKSKCATVKGSKVVFTPWLTFPFETANFQ